MEGSWKYLKQPLCRILKFSLSAANKENKAKDKTLTTVLRLLRSLWKSSNVSLTAVLSEKLGICFKDLANTTISFKPTVIPPPVKGCLMFNASPTTSQVGSELLSRFISVSDSDTSDTDGILVNRDNSGLQSGDVLLSLSNVSQICDELPVLERNTSFSFILFEIGSFQSGIVQHLIVPIKDQTFNRSVRFNVRLERVRNIDGLPLVENSVAGLNDGFDVVDSLDHTKRFQRSQPTWLHQFTNNTIWFTPITFNKKNLTALTGKSCSDTWPNDTGTDDDGFVVCSF
ncbi:hypothetical protein WICPIJ_008540 [Wickerhamomyces pijperi]|uniref:Uncharacterized protein n=1 Tax=Wickerhamomyces pijperi TaxID=599730 RepID=A0A9P8PY64_WICPI|nr:hypothetical protein WICPIJ_008540 [Wickerhamomyces pijperi]